MNRAVLYAVLLPALVTMVLTVAFVLFVDSHEVVPHDFNATTWREFSSRMGRELKATGTVSHVGVLLAVHTPHVYVCMPMYHVTKIRNSGCASFLLSAAAHARFASVSRCTASVMLLRARLLDLAHELCLDRVSITFTSSAKCEAICNFCAISAPGSCTFSSSFRLAMWCSSVR